MQRFVALVVILLAGLSLLVSTQAYKVAQPVNAAQVTVVSTNQGALTVDIGPQNPYGMAAISSGRLVLDMRKGPGGTNFGFGTNSRFTLNQIIRVTNTTGGAKNISVTANATFASLTNVTGLVGGTGSAIPQPIAVPGGQFVDITLEWTTTAATGVNSPMTLTVTGN